MRMIIDSNITTSEAVRANPEKGSCPPHILRQQCLLTVHYYGFDGEFHRGQIVVHEDVTTDVHDFFALALSMKFPFGGVVPLAHHAYLWDRDKTVLKGNLTYGFNYRTINGTERLSQHAHGRAVDINPLQNPCITKHGSEIRSWPDVEYDKAVPGTLYAKHPLVMFMESRGWTWCGHPFTRPEGTKVRDYMHFEKCA